MQGNEASVRTREMANSFSETRLQEVILVVLHITFAQCYVYYTTKLQVSSEVF